MHLRYIPILLSDTCRPDSTEDQLFRTQIHSRQQHSLLLCIHQLLRLKVQIKAQTFCHILCTNTHLPQVWHGSVLVTEAPAMVHVQRLHLKRNTIQFHKLSATSLAVPTPRIQEACQGRPRHCQLSTSVSLYDNPLHIQKSQGVVCFATVQPSQASQHPLIIPAKKIVQLSFSVKVLLGKLIFSQQWGEGETTKPQTKLKPLRKENNFGGHAKIHITSQGLRRDGKQLLSQLQKKRAQWISRCRRPGCQIRVSGRRFHAERGRFRNTFLRTRPVKRSKMGGSTSQKNKNKKGQWI